MSMNSRFAVAVHFLTGMAVYELAGQSSTSEKAAHSANTHPVVVRRILGDLREAGLVRSQPGVGGGWRFVRPPDQITLRDVYRALQDDPLFTMHHRAPDPTCFIGCNIQAVMGEYFQRAETALEDELAKVTIADLRADLLARLPAEAGCVHG